jgi:NADPH-dependent curcumin reductase CurA
MGAVLRKRLKIQGLIIFDYYNTPRHADFLREIPAWLADGTLKYTEDIVDGLENAPSAFVGMLQGRNFGKLVIRVGADD